MRLILHTAAYWLIWRMQQAIPKTSALAAAEFATLRLRLLKVAARVIETATRIRMPLRQPVLTPARSAPSQPLSNRPQYSRCGRAAVPVNPVLQSRKPLEYLR